MSKRKAYDWSDVNNFLQALFPHYASGIDGDNTEAAAKAADEYLAFCLKLRGSKQRGWTPLKAGQMVARFKKDPQQGCYVNTASLRMGIGFDGTTPALRHQNQYVKGVFFFILDDIGTRTQVSDLPKLLQKPTTSVETSPGNFQFGYRLIQPFRDVIDARYFITALYSMGKWDGGGAVAAKFVRLPCGINGKMHNGSAIPGKTDFHVRLDQLNPDLAFDADEVLDAVGYDRGSMVAKKRRMAHALATTSGKTHVSGDGIADAFMDWLLANGQMYSGGDVWQTVLCPWRDQHSAGGEPFAGYKPLGLGAGDQVYFRSFNCFHDHCQGRKFDDYLEQLKKDFDTIPEGIRRHDPAARLLRDYLYIPAASGYPTGCVVDIETGQKFNVAGYRNLYAEKIDGKPLASHFMESPSRPMADALRSRPDLLGADGELLFPIPDTGLVAFNDYRPLDFPPIEPDEAIIAPFLEHAEYLMPVPEEREYVLNWMAAKVQNPSFRGAVIMMVAPIEGTGRSTWWRMFGQLFPADYYGEISPKQFHSGWDDFMTNVLTVCGEVSDKSGDADRWNLSDAFKARFDTSPSFLDLNLKGKGMLRDHMCCLSFVALTNHGDAMRIEESDRRLFVVQNPLEPRPPEYFQKFYAWSKSDVSWRQHLHWWLMNRDISGWDGQSRPPMTTAKRRMMLSSDGPIGAAVRSVFDNWQHGYIHEEQVFFALGPFRYSLIEYTGMTGGRVDAAVRAEINRHILDDGKYAQAGGKDSRAKIDTGVSTKFKRRLVRLKVQPQPPGKKKIRDVPSTVAWGILQQHMAQTLSAWNIAPDRPESLDESVIGKVAG